MGPTADPGCSQQKYVAQNRKQDDEDDIDFFVLNPHSVPATGESPFVLSSANLKHIERAIVVVKGWHTETFSPAVLAHAPEIFRFVEAKVFEQAKRAFDTFASTSEKTWKSLETGSQSARVGLTALNAKIA